MADLHYALKQFDWLVATAGSHDVLIIGGDLLDLSSALELDVQIVVVEKYLARLAQKTRLLVSSGNHDGDHRSAADESIARWLKEAKTGEVYVDGDSFTLDETLFTICPWWDGPVSQAELVQLLDRDAAKPKSRWIWIHHAPPDRSPVSWAGRKFGGDECLVEWIRRFEPDFVFSGHIHNAPFLPAGSWIDRLGKTWVFNPGRQIGPTPAYISLDLATMTAEWTSFEGTQERRLETAAPARLTSAAAADAGA